MSTKRGHARTAILAAAERLFLSRGYQGVGLEEVAETAGVSRQAVYNHFSSKSGLLLAIADEVERRADLGNRLRSVATAENGVAALRALVETVASVDPQLYPHQRLVHAARDVDESARALWENRMTSRRRGFGAVVRRLSDEGLLRAGLAADTARDVLWTLLSPLTYEFLVVDGGWSQRRYKEWLADTVEELLLTPAARDRHPRR